MSSWRCFFGSHNSLVQYPVLVEQRGSACSWPGQRSSLGPSGMRWVSCRVVKASRFFANDQNRIFGQQISRAFAYLYSKRDRGSAAARSRYFAGKCSARGGRQGRTDSDHSTETIASVIVRRGASDSRRTATQFVDVALGSATQDTGFAGLALGAISFSRGDDSYSAAATPWSQPHPLPFCEQRSDSRSLGGASAKGAMEPYLARHFGNRSACRSALACENCGSRIRRLCQLVHARARNANGFHRNLAKIPYRPMRGGNGSTGSRSVGFE